MLMPVQCTERVIPSEGLPIIVRGRRPAAGGGCGRRGIRRAVRASGRTAQGTRHRGGRGSGFGTGHLSLARRGLCGLRLTLVTFRLRSLSRLRSRLRRRLGSALGRLLGRRGRLGQACGRRRRAGRRRNRCPRRGHARGAGLLRQLMGRHFDHFTGIDLEHRNRFGQALGLFLQGAGSRCRLFHPVSYTHLTLPTICSV